MDSMQNDETAVAATTVSAEDLRRVLSYDKAQRNPLLVRMRKQFDQRVPDIAEDEIAFYQALVDLAKNDTSRTELNVLLDTLVRDKNGKSRITYRLLARVTARMRERLRACSESTWSTVQTHGALYQDALTLCELEALGEPIWARVYRWMLTIGLERLPDSTQPLAATVFSLLQHGEALLGESETVLTQKQVEARPIGNPLEDWTDSRSRLSSCISELGERPDVDAARELLAMVDRLYRSACAWSDTGRIDSARQRLADMIEAAAAAGTEAVADAQKALIEQQWSANDIEWLETLASQIDTQIHRLQLALQASEAAEAAVKAACDEKRYRDLAELGPLAEKENQQLAGERSALKEILQALAFDRGITAKNAADVELSDLSRESTEAVQALFAGESIPLLLEADGLVAALEDDEENDLASVVHDKALIDGSQKADMPTQMAIEGAAPFTQTGAPVDAASETVVVGVSDAESQALSMVEEVFTDVDTDVVNAAGISSSNELLALDAPDATLFRSLKIPADTASNDVPGAAPPVPVVAPVYAAAAIWQAVAEHRCGLAWHLARALPSVVKVPSALFAALALAPCVRSAEDEASEWLGKQVHQLLETLGGERGSFVGEAADLLLFAVAVRPVLLSPYITDAQQLLLDAPALESLEGFKDLRRTLLDTLAHGVMLTPALLQGGYPQAQWNREIQALRDRATDWLNEAPTRNTNFHRATVAWKHWSSTGGEIARIVATLAQVEPWPIDELHECRERLRNIDTELERMLFEFDPRQSKSPIDGKARKKLLEYFTEVRDLLAQALELQEARPKDQNRMQVVDDLRRRLREQIGEAQRGLTAWRASAAEDPDNRIPAIAVKASVRRTLDDLQALLGDTQASAEPAAPWTALYGELLLSADIRFTDDWLPAPAPDAATLIGLIAQAPTVVTALENRCACGDLRAARRLLDLQPPALPDASVLEDRFIELGEIGRNAVFKRRENLCTRLELMLQQGVLGEQQYADANQVLEHYVDSQTGDLRYWQQRFTDIEAEVDQALDQRREALAKRLTTVDAPELRERIERLLADDDLLTAHEYLDHCERGEPLPQDRQERLELEMFFPVLVQPEARATQRPQREDVMARRPLGRVRLDGLPDERLESSAELVDVWREMESGRRRLPGQLTPARDPARPKQLLTRLFKALDFADVDISPRTEAGAGAATTYHLRCGPLADRAFCPVPQYGSQADGQYALRCLEGGPENGVDALLAQVRNLRGAVFALVLGWLDESMRRELAQVCRTHRQTVLVIDEALIQALAGVAGDRRRALFEWTLPFTWINPFSITASRVPPELFHGRQRALELVCNPREGYLIYGGRQLGKTALLTMTEHDCHRLTEERLALRIDLKSEGIGYGFGPNELWEVIARHLHGLKLGIVDDRIVVQAGSDGGKLLRERLKHWLGAKPHRQLLLMLDEADAFMLKDAEAEHPFVVLGRLKALMESTDHRFKVVLAGLRDVQRMARIACVPNSPLAHLGHGICVGPLLADGESSAARRLLVAPLRALGFRFDSEELPGRILALANYYPSLIQVFGYYLIEHMMQRGGMLAGPPYRINSQNIDDTFRQASLRDEFVKRFRMTVALDPRYHLIALLIAQKEIDRRQEGVPESIGVDTGWVRKQALQWWPKGFARQDSFDDFCTLLGEMVGLGVLRVVSGSLSTQPGYALRSPGIVQMLGGSESILHALDAISTSEPPQLYDADVFHPYLVNETGPRSPLTGRQEERLFALRREASQPVLALIGTALAVTPDNLHKLVARYDRHYRTVPASIDSAETLCRWLAADGRRQSSAQPGSDGFSLAVVPATVPWTPTWLDIAAADIQHLHLRAHLLFVGDEAAAWRWVSSDIGERTELLRMLPWTSRAIRQWLQDCSRELDEQEFKRLLTLSGGWGRLLERFGEMLDGGRNRRTTGKAFTALEGDLLAEKPIWPDPAIPETLHVLRKLADPTDQVSGANAELTELIAEDLDPVLRARVGPALKWAEWVGLLEIVSGTDGKPLWRLNSVLARLLDSRE